MKAKLILLLSFWMIISCNESWRHAEIRVHGNCEMCQEKIESALKVPGIHRASWSPESKVLELDFNEKKISLQAIRQRVAEAGYDTDSLRAPDSTYARLHECCRYREKQP